MLHVVLLILKILGIILLSILCLILLILLALLFAAISYQVRVRKDENIHVSATVSWLFRIITVQYLLDIVEETKQELRICLFGIPILRPLEKKPEKKKTEKKARKRNDSSKRDVASTEALPVTEQATGTEQSVESETISEPVKERLDDCEKKTVKIEETRKKETVWMKICKLFRKLDQTIADLKKKIVNLRETIRGILEKKDKYLGFLTQEEHKRAESAALRELLHILKKIRPRKLEGVVHFGFDDPSQTGKIYGAACVLYAWYPKGFEVIPDFEQEVLECNIRLRGKIRLYVFVVAAVKLLLNKDVRNMYKDWKQI